MKAIGLLRRHMNGGKNRECSYQFDITCTPHLTKLNGEREALFAEYQKYESDIQTITNMNNAVQKCGYAKPMIDAIDGVKHRRDDIQSPVPIDDPRDEDIVASDSALDGLQQANSSSAADPSSNSTDAYSSTEVEWCAKLEICRKSIRLRESENAALRAAINARASLAASGAMSSYRCAYYRTPEHSHPTRTLRRRFDWQDVERDVAQDLWDCQRATDELRGYDNEVAKLLEENSIEAPAMNYDDSVSPEVNAAAFSLVAPSKATATAPLSPLVLPSAFTADNAGKLPPPKARYKLARSSP